MVWESCSKLDNLEVQVWRSHLDLGGIAGDIGEPEICVGSRVKQIPMHDVVKHVGAAGLPHLIRERCDPIGTDVAIRLVEFERIQIIMQIPGCPLPDRISITPVSIVIWNSMLNKATQEPRN